MAKQPIEQWLDDLGLSQYAEAFLRHGIDMDVLRDLNSSDLAELHVNLGDRKRIMRAAALPWRPTRSDELPGAERRHMTVMFCDLVGSTALSTQLDPEDLREIIRRYQACCEEIIKSFSGWISRYMGDGILIHFGFPVAHELDAERAVRAGLAIVGAVSRLEVNPGTYLQARVGIATGEVVAGDVIGEGPSKEQMVVGETINLASRLQDVANPGSVVISASTQRLVHSFFRLSPLGHQTLKGFRVPVLAWKVEDELGVQDRFEARHAAMNVSSLVGRKSELDRLWQRWEKTRTGQGQVVFLAGEAGIGKSRLVHAFRKRLNDEAHLSVRNYCSPHYQNTALFPVVRQLEESAGLDQLASPAAKAERLKLFLAQWLTDATDAAVALLAGLLSIPGDFGTVADSRSPQRLKERTLMALETLFDGLASKRPTLVVFEDLHWVDPTTIELLDRLIARAANMPVMLLLTFRPEFEPPWPAAEHMESLSLRRLSIADGHRLVASISAGKSLPDIVLQKVVAQTDGNPLFIEEFTKTILESGILSEKSDSYTLEGPCQPWLSPILSTIH